MRSRRRIVRRPVADDERGLSGASPFRAAFATASAQTGVPLSLLVATAYEESRMNPNAHSGAGATGLLQLMPATARELRLDGDDPGANVLAGARYLRQMIDRFGSLDLALAAYNAGPSAVEDARWRADDGDAALREEHRGSRGPARRLLARACGWRSRASESSAGSTSCTAAAISRSRSSASRLRCSSIRTSPRSSSWRRRTSAFDLAHRLLRGLAHRRSTPSPPRPRSCAPPPRPGAGAASRTPRPPDACRARSPRPPRAARERRRSAAA